MLAWTTRCAGALFLALVLLATSHPAARAQMSREEANRRLLCAKLFGDMLDPVERIRYQRCLQGGPAAGIARLNAPARPLPPIAHPPVALTRAAAASSGRGACLQGFVWREATPDDHVCVPPERRQQVADENRTAIDRVMANGRTDMCRQGFVWREASPDDHVCVTPAVRAQVRAENQAAASRRN